MRFFYAMQRTRMLTSRIQPNSRPIGSTTCRYGDYASQLYADSGLQKTDKEHTTQQQADRADAVITHTRTRQLITRTVYVKHHVRNTSVFINCIEIYLPHLYANLAAIEQFIIYI